MFSTGTRAAEKSFTGPARGDGESFDAYKQRRAATQQAERAARKKLQGGSQSARYLRRHPRAIVIEGEVIHPKPMRGNFGRDVMASFARIRLAAMQHRQRLPELRKAA